MIPNILTKLSKERHSQKTGKILIKSNVKPPHDEIYRIIEIDT